MEKEKRKKTNALEVVKKKNGRPLKDIDPKEVRFLSEIGCTREEIAKHVGCHVDTLYARFSEDLAIGDARGGISIKRNLYLLANNEKNLTAMMFILRCRFGWKESKAEEAGNTTINVIINQVPR